MRSKTKKKIYYVIGISFLVIFILANLNTSNVRAQENYTNYLYNQPLNIVNDKAMILAEGSDGGNNYRNIFDSGFIFPAKLSNQMFSAYATSWTQYSFTQMYLDNLNNDMAFKSNDNSENIEEQINIEENYLNYTYGNKTADSYSKTYLVVPDSDISTTWISTGGNHYTEVDDYPAENDADNIKSLYDNDNFEVFGFSDIPVENHFQITRIRIHIRYKNDNAGATYFMVTMREIGTEFYIDSNQFYTSGGGYRWSSTTFNGNWDYDLLNNCYLRLQPMQIWPIPPAQYIHISSIYIEITETQNDISVIESFRDKVSFNTTKDIPYENQTVDYKPVFLTFYYEMCLNISGIDIFAYIYDYDSTTTRD